SALRASSLTKSSRLPWEVVTPPPCPLRSRRPHRPPRQLPLLRPRRPLLPSSHRRRQPGRLRHHPCGLKRGPQRVVKRDAGSASPSAAACTESPVRTCFSGGTTAEWLWSISLNSTRALHRDSGPVPP